MTFTIKKALFIFLFIFAFNFLCFSSEVSILNSLSPQEIETLNIKLRDMFEHYGLGDTLFGNKSIHRSSFCALKNDFELLEDKQLKMTISSLKKLVYENNKYKVDYRLFHGVDDIKGHMEFVIINKQTLKETISENIDLFREKIGSHFQVEKIYKDILNNRAQYLDRQATLYGILEGYGPENAQIWESYGALVDEMYKNTTADAYLDQIDNKERIEEVFNQLLEEYSNQNSDKWGETYRLSRGFDPFFHPIDSSYTYLPCFPAEKTSLELINERRKTHLIVKKLLSIQSPLELFFDVAIMQE